MKYRRSILLYLLSLCVICSCGNPVQQEDKEYGKATQELISIVESDPQVKELLI